MHLGILCLVTAMAVAQPPPVQSESEPAPDTPVPRAESTEPSEDQAGEERAEEEAEQDEQAEAEQAEQAEAEQTEQAEAEQAGQAEAEQAGQAEAEQTGQTNDAQPGHEAQPIAPEATTESTRPVPPEPVPEPAQAPEPEPTQPVEPGQPVAEPEEPAPKVRSAAPARQQTVLVFDTAVVGVPESAGASLTNAMAAQVAQHPELSVLTLADIDDLLELEKLGAQLGCEDDFACQAEISRLAHADLVLSSSVGAVGNMVVVSLALVDPIHAIPMARQTGTVGEIEEVPDVLPGLLAALFAWEGATAAPTFQLPEGQTTSFAVFDLRPAEISAEVVQSLTQILSASIKQIHGTTVISSEDVDAMLQLEEQKERIGCLDDTSCLAEIGGALGVDKLVVGHVGKLAELYVVSLRLIDTRNVRVDARVAESFRGDEGQLIRAVRHAGRQLLSVAADTSGQLAVSSSVPGAEVFVDNEQRGELPLPPIESLLPGRHTVRVTKDGFFDWQSDIYVDPGDTTAVWAALNEQPEKWYQKWWVWVGIGVVVAAGTTAAVIALQPEEPGYGTGSATVR